jgi:NAD(P)-dependent dehydrogenase (short-subunit alcohol dehydrogenase family)
VNGTAGTDSKDGTTGTDSKDGTAGKDSKDGTAGRHVVDRDLLGLLDAVALVTGGAASLGRGCATQLARAGCHVAIVDITDAAPVVAKIEALGRRAQAYRYDVRDRDAVHAMVARVVADFGGLDVAVNTVGSTSPPKPFLDVTPDEWQAVVERNLTTTMLCCQAEAITMINGGVRGRIVNIASVSGVVGAPNVAAYGAGNAGVVNFTASAALELARYGIRVNCIVPGAHDTETTKAAAASADPALGEWMARAAQAPPLGRLGQPVETGGAAVFLASNLSSYVTGHALVCDGGIVQTTARPPIGMDMAPAALTRR